MAGVIKLKIHCVELPPPTWGGHGEIWLGVQKGKEVTQEIKLPASDATFEVELKVGDETPGSKPNFLGPFSQGPVGERFVYLCWGSKYAGHWIGFRRAKIPLSGLTWEALKSNRLLAKVRCTDAKGGPICATIRGDFVTWSSSTE